MRSVRYEHQAAAALDAARRLFRRVDDAIIALEWAIVRDDRAGLPLVSGGRVRLFVFDRARAAGFPRIECLLEYQETVIVIHDLEFS